MHLQEIPGDFSMTSVVRASERSSFSDASGDLLDVRGLGSAGRAGVLLLAMALLLIAPLAHAMPPDEIWQPGLYDGADFDDVVLLITAGISSLPAALPAWSVAWTVQPIAAPAEHPVAVARPACSLQGRAPPGPGAIR
jgi:hypothetical protein